MLTQYEKLPKPLLYTLEYQSLANVGLCIHISNSKIVIVSCSFFVLLLRKVKDLSLLNKYLFYKLAWKMLSEIICFQFLMCSLFVCFAKKLF